MTKIKSYVLKNKFSYRMKKFFFIGKLKLEDENKKNKE